MNKQIEAVLKTLNWSAPIHTKNEIHIEAKPNNVFWDCWREHKKQMLSANIRVIKRDDQFVIIKHGTIQSQTMLNTEKLNYEHLLKPHQIEHVKNLKKTILKYNGAIDASQTGTGKTYAGIVLSKELNFPIFVICPKAVIPPWKETCKITNTPVIDVINYEAFVGGRKTTNERYSHRWAEPYKGKYNQDRFKILVPKNSLIIFDEAHRLSRSSTLSFKLFQSFYEQGYTILLSSATLADSPLKMAAPCLVAKIIDKTSNFMPWAMNHGVKRGRDGEYFFKTGTELSNEYIRVIHKQFFPERGSRMIKDSSFMKTQIIAESYFTKNKDNINHIYEELKIKLKDIPDEKGKLIARLRARQMVELDKVPIFCELGKDFIEEGNSVVIFVNFKETVAQLAKKFKTNSVIEGGQNSEERQKIIDDFQHGRSRIIICNIKAGGVGINLHDEYGNFPRVSLISPTDNATDFKQALGRIDRSGSKSCSEQRVIFAAETIEDKIRTNLQHKLEIIDGINGISNDDFMVL